MQRVDQIYRGLPVLDWLTPLISTLAFQLCNCLRVATYVWSNVNACILSASGVTVLVIISVSLLVYNFKTLFELRLCTF